MDREAAFPTAIVVPASAPNAYGIIRSLAERCVPVLALEHGPTPLRSSRLCRFAVVPDPDTDPDAFTAALLDIARSLPAPPVVFATQDLHAWIVQTRAPLLAGAIRFPFMPRDRFRACLDKNEMLRIAAGAGLPVPETHHPVDMDGVRALLPELGRWPYIVKPPAKFDLRPGRPTRNMEFHRIHGTKALRAADPASLLAITADLFGRGLDLLVQEEIEGPTGRLSAIDFYVDRAGRLAAWHTGRKMRQYPADFGTCTLGRSAPVDRIAALCRSFVDAVGFRGLGNMEFKERDGVPYLMEINPRAWMWIQLATAAGVNLPWRAYLDLLGRPEPHDGSVRQGTTWVDLRMDVMHRLARGRSVATEAFRWRDWLGSLSSVRVEARYTPRDPGLVLDALFGAAARRIRS